MSTAAVTALSPILAAAAEGERPSLVVSLHDVAPATHAPCIRILDELHRLGISCTSLLVVPNYHRDGELVANREIISWLRELEAAGHETVIHGYFHERPISERETLRDRFMTRVYTNREGEFYDLSYDEAFRRISTAREQFKAAGLKPHGFIAPAWLLSIEGERAARDCEIEYTTRLASVRDLRAGNTYSARSLVYSVRTGWRRSASLAWNAVLFRRCKYAPLLRISIHPVDIEHREVWQQITRLISAALANREPTTYCDWVARARVNASN